jgi:hypothetical protein
MKQLYIPPKPLLASFSGYIPETQCYQGFDAIKIINLSFSKNSHFVIILAR